MIITEREYKNFFLLLKLTKSKQISKKQYDKYFTNMYIRLNQPKKQSYSEPVKTMIKAFGGKRKKLKKLKGGGKGKKVQEFKEEVNQIPTEDRIQLLEKANQKMFEMMTVMMENQANHHSEVISLHNSSLTNQERAEINQSRLLKTTKVVKSSVLKIGKTTEATKYMTLAKADWSDISYSDMPKWMRLNFKKSVNHLIFHMPLNIAKGIFKDLLDMAVAPILFIVKTPKKIVRHGISFLLFTYLLAEGYNFVVIPQIQDVSMIPNPTVQTLIDDINNDMFMSQANGFKCSNEFYCEKYDSMKTPLDYYVMSYIPDEFSDNVKKYAWEPAKKSGNVVMEHYNKRTSIATKDIYKRSGAKEYVNNVNKVVDASWDMAVGVLSSAKSVTDTAVTITTSVLNPLNWYSGVKGLFSGGRKNKKKVNKRTTKPKSTKKSKKSKSKNPSAKKKKRKQ